MTTLLEALRALSHYPIPLHVLEASALVNGLDTKAPATGEALRGRPFRTCRAELRLWLSVAPDISQGGQSYSFSEEQRRALRRMALGELEQLKEDSPQPGVRYGYKGDRL